MTTATATLPVNTDPVFGTFMAVYGTLREGMSNNSLMKNMNYEGQDYIEGRIYSLGGFPGWKPAQSPDEKVLCDLYSFPEDPELANSCLEGIDCLEGYDPNKSDEENNFYIRRTTTGLNTGKTLSFYEYQGSISPFIESHLVVNGDWVKGDGENG